MKHFVRKEKGMNIVIQKFGGTSVATPETRMQVVEKIIQTCKEGNQPVVVVSAMGRLGAPYATDTLLQFIKDDAGNIKPRELDVLLSCGELISAVMMATLLENHGYPAVALTGGQGGIVTDSLYGQADLIEGRPDKILSYIEQGRIPVVAGFQGITIDGEITTLGRGGSDTTAAMLGSILGATRIEIFTDVDGIMTADPRVCNKASIINELTYNEVFQMADSGAKVIHPRAVEYAMRANIPLMIKNTFTDAEGTSILQILPKNVQEVSPKVLTGIAHRMNRIQVRVMSDFHDECEILGQIADAHISIDLINIFPESKIFTIDAQDQVPLEQLLQVSGHEYQLVGECCKITAIGERMTGVPGVMARIIKCLTKARVEVLQTADSLTTIACLIKEKHLSQAITALHEEFNL